nr:4392_t:CDS:2 [Entrophospora candida]
MNYSKAISATGLIAGLNQEELRTTLAFMGATSQPSRASYWQYRGQLFDKIEKMADDVVNLALIKSIEKVKNEGKKLLCCGFDVSWTHVRNVYQASGELIFDGFVEGMSHKPVIAYSICEKPCIATKDGEKVVAHEGNFEKSSKQMEHQILIDILYKITPILVENDVLLEVAVDGDLDSNKTLASYGIVNQIYADLKHKTKTIRNHIKNQQNKRWKDFEQVILDYYTKCVYKATRLKKDYENKMKEQKIDLSFPPDNDALHQVQTVGLFKHLCDSNCWEKVCWHVKNPELDLKTPNLKTYSDKEKQEFKKMLINVIKKPIQTTLITSTHTCQNESMNHVKLMFLDKKIDYWKSFKTHHSLSIILNNLGDYEFLVGLNTLFDDFSFTSTDLCNLEKICDGRNKKHEQTVKKVQQNNASKWQRINQIEKTLTGFDFEQDLIPYGVKLQKQLEAHQFHPSFAEHICNFDAIIKCCCCQSFPKYSAEGLCKICYFYYIHNLHDQFSNKNFTITKTTPLINTPPILSALQIFFGHNEFCEGEQSSIESFIENKNTLVTIPTGLTLDFSPLKALIEDQVIELICMGIPCAGLYAATENSHLYQEKVAAEIALKLTQIIFLTPEKFALNIGFRNMIEQIAAVDGVQFIFDEVHCMLDQEYF